MSNSSDCFQKANEVRLVNYSMPDLWPWTITAAALAAAWLANLKLASVQAELNIERKRIGLLEAEIAQINSLQDKQKQAVGDEFTKPLTYPKNHIS